MKPDEWMPLNVGHYLRDTARLTRDQHGAYLLLLFAYWTNGGALPADDAQLAATVRATRAERRRLKPVIAPYFQERDGLWFNKRAEIELAHARGMVEKKSRAGKAGANARWQTDGKRNADALPQQSQTDAPRPLPLAWQGQGGSLHPDGRGGREIPRSPRLAEQNLRQLAGLVAHLGAQRDGFLEGGAQRREPRESEDPHHPR